jgi:hypothetical protein
MSSYVTNILIKQWWHIYEGMYLMPYVCVCSICLYMVFKHGQHMWVLKIIISIITTFGNVDMNIYLQSLNLDDT